MAKHDWPKICGEFITAEKNLTLDKLARKHGVRPSYLRERAGREDWKGQQSKYRAKVERDRQKELISQRSRQLARIDSYNLDLVEALLKMQYDLVRHLQEQSKEVNRSDRPKTLKPYEITYFVQNAATIQQICESYRGDTFGAIQILANQGILSEDACHQIAQVLGESEEGMSDAIAKILRGEGEYPD